MKAITKDLLQNVEKSYNVKKIGDNLFYRINVKIDNKKVVKNVPALGCQLQENYSLTGFLAPFNVFITPHQMHNAYYLLMYKEFKNFYFIIDLIENVELPPRNDLPQRSGFLNKITKSFKTHFPFKEKGKNIKIKDQ